MVHLIQFSIKNNFINPLVPEKELFQVVISEHESHVSVCTCEKKVTRKRERSKDQTVR